METTFPHGHSHKNKKNQTKPNQTKIQPASWQEENCMGKNISFARFHMQLSFSGKWQRFIAGPLTTHRQNPIVQG